MTAIDIGIRHDDDFVIAQFVSVEFSEPMLVPSAAMMVPIS